MVGALAFASGAPDGDARIGPGTGAKKGKVRWENVEIKSALGKRGETKARPAGFEPARGNPINLAG